MPAVTPAEPVPAPPPAPAPAPGFKASRPPRGLRFLVFGRAIPTAFYGLLVYLQFHFFTGVVGNAYQHPSPLNVLNATGNLFYLIFSVIPVVIFFTRPAPKSYLGSFPARFAAFAGTTIQLGIGIFINLEKGRFQGPTLYPAGDVTAYIKAIAIIAGFAFAVYAIAYLRYGFSIVPQATSLATRGPYRVCRHPLYLAELTAAFGGSLQDSRLLPVLGFVALFGLQLMRTRYEERLLRYHFPEYAAYARTTRRLIPGVF
ncbi:MAG: isoprenylcysteine carboxylmethyltransferase family protein [Candidatus Dormibacteria bacterium]